MGVKQKKMKVGLDISPLTTSHQVRGIGFYTQRLRDSLLKLAEKKKDFKLIEIDTDSKQKVDIIHYPYFSPFFRTLPLIKFTKTIVTVHDLIPLKFPDQFPPGRKGKWKWFWQRLSLKTARAIITDSHASKKDIIKFAGIKPKKIFTIYLAADSEFQVIGNRNHLDRLRKRYNLPKKFVLYVGDLNWNKNVMMLARVCSQLKYPLVVIGKQSLTTDYDKEHIENQEVVKFQKYAQQYHKHILRLGFVPTEDLAGIYNLAICYAQPSIAEGFGLPVLEAMASGCPVITSKKTSLSEIAGQAALLINPKEEKDLIESLKILWEKPGARKSYITLGLDQAKRFSWEKTAKKTYEVYKRVWGK